MARTNVLMLLALLSVTGACVPTAARKNARLNEGVDIDFSGGANMMLEGKDENGDPTETKGIVHLEGDFQVATKYENGAGLALQLKFPINFFFTSLDAYFQLPEDGSQWFFGVGAELGIASGFYGVATYFVDQNFYLSLTPRFLTGLDSDSDIVLINPQLSLGVAGEHSDISAFVSYLYNTGQGFNIEVDLFSDSGRRDYRKGFLLAGLSLRL